MKDYVEKKGVRFKVILREFDGGSTAIYEYEGNITELCVELAEFIENRQTRYRRILEKQLFLYEQKHRNVKFEIYNMESKKYKMFHRIK